MWLLVSWHRLLPNPDLWDNYRTESSSEWKEVYGGEERRDKKHAGIVKVWKIPHKWSQLIIMHSTGHLVFERKGRFKFHLYELPMIFTEFANGNLPRASSEKFKFCKHWHASNVIVGTQPTNNNTSELKSVRALCGSVQERACALRDGKVLGWNEMGGRRWKTKNQLDKHTIRSFQLPLLRSMRATSSNNRLLSTQPPTAAKLSSFPVREAYCMRHSSLWTHHPFP